MSCQVVPNLSAPEEFAVAQASARPPEQMLPCNTFTGGQPNELQVSDGAPSSGGVVDAQLLHSLQLGSYWEQSFIEYNANLVSGTDTETAQQAIAPNEASFTSDLPSSAISDLLELVEFGIAVTWPSGLDERVARIILRERAGG